MTRENTADKGRRYLTEGRVIITAAGDGYVRARVRGDAAVHQVHDDSRGRICDCPARGLCCHLLAVGLVTAPSRSAP